MIVNFNGGAFLARAIADVLATDAPGIVVEVVVVDNASTDGSADGLATAFPTVQLLRSATNLGFSGGNNLALGDLSAIDAVALLNSDCFVSPGWLTPLIDALESDDRVGAASPKILFDGRWHPVELQAPTFTPGNGDGRALGVRVHDGPTPLLFGTGFSHPEPGFRWTDAGSAQLFVAVTPDPRIRLAAERTKTVTVHGSPVLIGADPSTVTVGGDVVDVINNAGNELADDWWGVERGFGQADRGQYDTADDIAGWCGACVLLRTEYLREVGLFDDRFFLYFEDTDLSLRGAKHGWRYRYEPASVVRHGHGLSAGPGSTLSRFCSERNRLVVIARYAPPRRKAQLWGRAAADAIHATRRKDRIEARLRWRSLAGAARILLGGKRRSRPQPD